MKKWRNGFCLGALFAGIFLMAGCRSGSYATGALYNVDYYPDYDVYYYPQAGLYYWQEEGNWHSGGDLPPRIDLHEHQHEELHLRTRTPWLEHRGPDNPHDGD